MDCLITSAVRATGAMCLACNYQPNVEGTHDHKKQLVDRSSDEVFVHLNKLLRSAEANSLSRDEVISMSLSDDEAQIAKSRSIDSTSQLTSSTFASAYIPIEVVRSASVRDNASDSEEVLEEKQCPICYGVLSLADQMYPLHCKSTACDFNYCTTCLHSMCKAEQDDYQLASDGSHQVKVYVRCPQCRSRYASNKYQSHQIIDAIVTLRTAAEMEPTMLLCDTDNLSDKKKRIFLRSTSLADLQEAYQCLRYYQNEVGKSGGISGYTTSRYAVPPLDWHMWSNVLEDDNNSIVTSSTAYSLKSCSTYKRFPSSVATSPNSPFTREGSIKSPTKSNRKPKAKILSDPTLLQGLEDFVAPIEQEFITELLLSEQPRRLAQAAHILHSALVNAATLASARQEEAACQTSDLYSIANRRQTFDLYELRKRFPLPMHMPRCVRWPVYNPRVDSDKALKLKPTRNTQSAAIASINGLAGGVGLRVGDILTHVGGRRVYTIHAFHKAMLGHYRQREQGAEQKEAAIPTPTMDHSTTFSSTVDTECDDFNHVLIVVNANDATAKKLKTRAQKMQKEGFLDTAAIMNYSFV